MGAGSLGMERIVGRTVGLLPAEIGLLYARWRYGVDLRRANPVDAVKTSTVPVLLIHGEEDINILPWHPALWLRPTRFMPCCGSCQEQGTAER